MQEDADDNQKQSKALDPATESMKSNSSKTKSFQSKISIVIAIFTPPSKGRDQSAISIVISKANTATTEIGKLKWGI